MLTATINARTGNGNKKAEKNQSGDKISVIKRGDDELLRVALTKSRKRVRRKTRCMSNLPTKLTSVRASHAVLFIVNH